MNDTDADQGHVTQAVESERERASKQIARAATSGGLTLGEYDERAGAIQRAATRDEIDAAVQGLPEGIAGESAAPHSGRIVAVFGGTRQRGRWRLGKRLRVLAALGGTRLDLSAAEVEVPESIITTVVIMGGALILVPPGVSVELSGLSLFGGKADRRAGGPPLPGSPLVRVRAFTLFGGLAVREP